MHLTIYPPNARVHVSAPIGMTEKAVRLFLITKIPWINQRISQILDQSRQTPREYVSGENHYFKGHRYRLKILYHNAPAKVEIQGNEYIKLYNDSVNTTVLIIFFVLILKFTRFSKYRLKKKLKTN